MKKESIEDKLKGYFGDSLIEVKVVMLGQMVDIELTYFDYVPVREARRWIDSHIEGVNNITLYRTYTEQRIVDALRTMYDEDSELQLAVESLLMMQSFADLEEGIADGEYDE